MKQKLYQNQHWIYYNNLEMNASIYIIYIRNPIGVPTWTGRNGSISNRVFGKNSSSNVYIYI